MKKLKRPNKEDYDHHNQTFYTIDMEKYCSQVEREYKQLKAERKCSNFPCEVCVELDHEIQILKEAVKTYKSGRYPSLAMLDKIEELIK